MSLCFYFKNASILFAISSKNVLNTSQRISKNSVVQQFKLVNVFEFVFS